MLTPEGRVKEAVKRLLRERGIWWFCPVSNGMGIVGIPDFVCVWRGRFLGIETKAPGKRNNTTPNQNRVLQEIKDHGGMTIVIDDVSQLKEYLHGQEELDRRGSEEAGCAA